MVPEIPKVISYLAALMMFVVAEANAYVLTLPIDGGTLHLARNSFSGSRSYSDGGETSQTRFSGTITDDGAIAGKFETIWAYEGETGVDKGSIIGIIQPNGAYKIKWTGDEPGEHEGLFEEYSRLQSDVVLREPAYEKVCEVLTSALVVEKDFFPAGPGLTCVVALTVLNEAGGRIAKPIARALGNPIMATRL